MQNTRERVRSGNVNPMVRALEGETTGTDPVKAQWEMNKSKRYLGKEWQWILGKVWFHEQQLDVDKVYGPQTQELRIGML